MPDHGPWPTKSGSVRQAFLLYHILYRFWQNCASVRQVSDLILKTGYVLSIEYVLSIVKGEVGIRAADHLLPADKGTRKWTVHKFLFSTYHPRVEHLPKPAVSADMIAIFLACMHAACNQPPPPVSSYSSTEDKTNTSTWSRSRSSMFPNTSTWEGVVINNKPTWWGKQCWMEFTTRLQINTGKTVEPLVTGGYLSTNIVHAFWTFHSTVETLYSTIRGVHEMRSCYRRIMVKYHNFVI